MTLENYKTLYNKYLDLFNDYGEKVFCTLKTESKLADAMKYSFFAGGKRVRPVLMLAYTEILGGNVNEILPFALALECIHTYSLIHDDLPALDGDVLRRGKPTCHVKYNESTAILAGDGLLNFAFEHALEKCNDKRDIDALLYLAKCSGAKGMLEGQQLDIENEKCNSSESTLLTIHNLKTCKLLTAPLAVPTIKYGKENLSVVEELGYLCGVIFQFTDDLLDVLSNEKTLGKSIGKDEEADKLTSIKLYGISGVKERILSLKEKAENIAKSLDNSGFLQCFITEITGRIK